MFLFQGRLSTLYLLFRVVTSFQLLTNASLPANVTSACASALLTDVNCSPVVVSLRNGDYYPETTLNSTCTQECSDSLTHFESNVVTACAGQSWTGYDDVVMPLTVVPEVLLFQFGLTCLTDSGRYCNNIAADAAQALGTSLLLRRFYKLGLVQEMAISCSQS